jgi:hypothetical protein
MSYQDEREAEALATNARGKKAPLMKEKAGKRISGLIDGTCQGASR